MRPLRRNRIVLIASLALLGGALGVTLNLLEPGGTVRTTFRPGGARGAHAPVIGYGTSRDGVPCGIEGDVGGEHRRVPLPGCTSYRAPEIRLVDGRAVAIWERDDLSIAVGLLASDLSVSRLVTVPRPRAAYGALLPRTDVRVEGDELSVWYDGSLVVLLDRGLEPWPGGALEVAAARLGPRGPVVLGGVLSLLLLCVLALGWTLLQPWRLASRRRAGLTLDAILAARGQAAMVDGRPVELDLAQATTMGASLASLAGQPVTLVLDAASPPTGTYRQLDRARVLEIWPGAYPDALDVARAMRTGAIASAIAALAVLILALDAYVAL